MGDGDGDMSQYQRFGRQCRDASPHRRRAASGEPWVRELLSLHAAELAQPPPPPTTHDLRPTTTYSSPNPSLCVGGLGRLLYAVWARLCAPARCLLSMPPPASCSTSHVRAVALFLEDANDAQTQTLSISPSPCPHPLILACRESRGSRLEHVVCQQQQRPHSILTFTPAPQHGYPHLCRKRPSENSSTASGSSHLNSHPTVTLSSRCRSHWPQDGRINAPPPSNTTLCSFALHNQSLSLALCVRDLTVH